MLTLKKPMISDLPPRRRRREPDPSIPCAVCLLAGLAIAAILIVVSTWLFAGADRAVETWSNNVDQVRNALGGK